MIVLNKFRDRVDSKAEFWQMSLPKRTLTVNDHKVSNEALKPEVAARKLAFQNLVQIANQLNLLSQFANEIFEDLIVQTLAINTRMQSASKKLAQLHAESASVLPIFKYQQDVVDRVEWKLEPKLYCNLFVPETENSSIRQVYLKCNSAPPLHILDEYRTDGKSCISFYSYPKFFAEEWKRMVSREDEERRQKRRNKKKTRATKTLSELIVKKYSIFLH